MNERITTCRRFDELSQNDRRDLVHVLQDMRKSLQLKNRRERAGAGTGKTHRSAISKLPPELQEIFRKFSPEMQKKLLRT